MTVVQDAPVAAESVAVSAVGRRVFTRSGLWFTPARSVGVAVFDSAGAEFGVGDLVVLPVLGERVQVATSSGGLVGWWLCHEELPNARVRVSVLTVDGLRQAVIEPRAADVRLVAGSDSCPPDLRLALKALDTTTKAAQLAELLHQQRIDALVEAAHEEANYRDWCGEFDDFMENNGLPRRSRDYEVTVEVPVTVTVTVTARSSDDAEEMVTRDDVWEVLTRDNLDMSQATVEAD